MTDGPDCDCGDCCAFGAGVAAGSALSGSSRNRGGDDCCCGFVVAILILTLIGLGIVATCSTHKEKEERRVGFFSRKEQAPNSWKIVEIQKDRRLFGQNHNTLLENTETKKRKVVEGVLGKPGETISLQ